MPCDSVQPRAQFVRFPQISEARRGGAKRVLYAIGGGVSVGQHPSAEVVQPIGVAVIHDGECLAVAACSSPDEVGVGAARADDIPTWYCCGHGTASPPALGRYFVTVIPIQQTRERIERLLVLVIPTTPGHRLTCALERRLLAVTEPLRVDARV